ncbi:MAG: DUF5110 domain-containing protein [Prevotella sp.]|nr:DUF5110 domain-containing protein [Prevotella sp.]
MVIKRVSWLVGCLVIALAAMGQTALMTADGSTAVFYPDHYDASQHAPSPIFEHEPTAILPLKADWQLRPVFSVADGRSVATVEVGTGVDLYGTGEVTGPLRRNGRSIQLWNVDTPAYGVDGGTHLYQSHPWVMGLREDGTAFGIIADNTWRQTITLTDTPSSYAATSSQPSKESPSSYAATPSQPSKSTVTFSSDGPPFRVVIIERESPQALMAALTDLTGHMELPPLWALGYQQCRFSYQPDARVREIADTLRLLRIPSDVIWMDIDYMDQYKIFTFSPREFPDPKGLNDYLHAHDFKAVYMIDPGVKVEPGYFVDDQGTAGDYWVKDKDGQPYVGNVWPGPCHFPDFTRPEVRHWWATLYKDYMATGIDGVWNDMNEPSVFGGPGGTMPVENKHGSEKLEVRSEKYNYFENSISNTNKTSHLSLLTSHLRFHNVYGLNMVRASRDGLLLANPQKRPFILSRSNFLGGHRYAATWTGDNLSSWDQLRLSVPMTLTLGLSGQPFNGPDIGGFCESADGDLVAHWTAMGVYFPFVRNHSIKGSVNQEPWAFTPEVLQACRTAIERRYRLMPYIYTLFREASVDGMPVMRPLFMADPKDLSLRREDRAFLLGPDLMIIPRWAPDAAQPQAEAWPVVPYAAISLQPHQQEDAYQPTLRQRPGSIIPLANLAQSTATLRTDSLTLLVSLDADGRATGTLYEDQGDGYAYRQGDYSLSRLEASLAKRQLTVSLHPTEGHRAQPQRWLRIACVRDGRVQLSAWQQGSEATMKIKK